MIEYQVINTDHPAIHSRQANDPLLGLHECLIIPCTVLFLHFYKEEGGSEAWFTIVN